MIEVNANAEIKNKTTQLLTSIFALDKVQHAPLAFHARMLQDYATDDIRHLWKVAQMESNQPKMPARAYTMALGRNVRHSSNDMPAGFIAIQRSSSMHSESEPSVRLPPTPTPVTPPAAPAGSSSSLVRTQRIPRQERTPRVDFEAPPATGHGVTGVQSQQMWRARTAPVAHVMRTSENEQAPSDLHPDTRTEAEQQQVPMTIQEQDATQEQPEDTPLDDATSTKRKQPTPAPDDEVFVPPKRTRSRRNAEHAEERATTGVSSFDVADVGADQGRTSARITRSMSGRVRKRTFSERR